MVYFKSMVAQKVKSFAQPYPREEKLLIAAHSLFPECRPSLSDNKIISAIEKAFDRSRRNKVGNIRQVPSSPEELVNLCLEHLKERSDPVLGTFFYSTCEVHEIFELDAISHEMQRQRMNMGVFYQYLIIELMREASKIHNSNIEAVFDGSREGDVVADLKTPGFSKGIRIYASVKKSADTVGGQDVPGVIRRLEGGAKAEKNLTRPYLCVFCYATPPGGEIILYTDSRSVRYNNEGHPFSENCESWEPGFIFPYISGRSATDIYKFSIGKIAEYFPFYSIKFKKECADLLKQKLESLGLVNSQGKLDSNKFLKFITE